MKKEVMALMMEPRMPSAELVTDGILCSVEMTFRYVLGCNLGSWRFSGRLFGLCDD